MEVVVGRPPLRRRVLPAVVGRRGRGGRAPPAPQEPPEEEAPRPSRVARVRAAVRVPGRRPRRVRVRVRSRGVDLG